jgi:hypothetical protein
VNEDDLLGLPEVTRNFIDRLIQIGFDRTRIYGLFVMIGLNAAAPNTQEKLEEIFSHLQRLLPIDRSKNLDEIVGHIYGGYDREIAEFCFRSGIDFNFREIKIPNVEKSIYIVNPKNEGLLTPSVHAVEKLSDSTKLFDSFMFEIGKRSVENEATLLEAFQCGIFQIQLFALSDIQGAMQIAKVISSLMPPFLSQCFIAVNTAQTDYFIGLQTEQIALLSLMQPMEQSYAQLMWAFQSSLFFRNGKSIADVDKLSHRKWFEWVLQNAIEFDEKYSSQILPFSSSNITLSDVPTWNQNVRVFETYDSYIEQVWGFTAAKLENNFESLEYKALLVHLIYSSLTASKEIVH